MKLIGSYMQTTALVAKVVVSNHTPIALLFSQLMTTATLTFHFTGIASVYINPGTTENFFNNQFGQIL